MIIYVYFREDGKVGGVHIVDEEKHTAKEVEEKAKSMNEQSGREIYRVINIPVELEEAMLYLVGEKKYKVYSDIDDLDNTLNEVGSDIRALHDDAFELSERLDRIEKMFEIFKKEHCNGDE